MKYLPVLMASFFRFGMIVIFEINQNNSQYMYISPVKKLGAQLRFFTVFNAIENLPVIDPPLNAIHPVKC